MRYPVEQFTPEERAILAPHFTNLDRPVFALVNLPETVKGALFARYSRYSGTVRRLYLEEFAADAPAGGRPFDDEEGARAAQLYERVFVGYGDDSIAQVGGAHVACEWVSNILTKLLQRGRLAAYLEQSTRYIPYDKPLPDGGYRFYRDEELGPQFAAGDGRAVRDLLALADRRSRPGRRRAGRAATASRRAPWQRSIRAKALDLLRGLLPAATLSHVGIYASGQAYEQLILRLMASPLPEAREFGGMILAELKQVMPSFVSRVERPDRGGEWVSYLEQRREQTEGWVARLGLDRRDSGEDAPSVELIHVDGSEEDLLAACLFEAAGASETEILARIDVLDRAERAELLAAVVGERANRRHRPGRGFEALRYRFEIVSDYGAFRDLQRHRMLTCQWQRLGPDLGAGVPDEVRRSGRRRRVRTGARDLPQRVRAAARRRPCRAGALRAQPRLPDPLHARPQRPRGDAPDRAALRPRGPPHLPRRRPGDARADRRHPSRRRRHDEPRRHLRRAPPGADHERDPHAPEASSRGGADGGTARAQSAWLGTRAG